MVLDGVIATAGALIAHTANPNVVQYLFAGHHSVEIGQRAALDLSLIHISEPTRLVHSSRMPSSA